MRILHSVHKKVPLIPLLVFFSLSARAQIISSGTGLLSAPSADMNDSGTFTITNVFLNKHLTTDTAEFGWNYHTFQYGFGITFWSRLEVDYACTIFNGKWNPDARTTRQKIIRNQDRQLSSKFLLIRENDFGYSWMPSLAIGVRDIDSGIISHMNGSPNNGFFTCLYVALSKHVQSPFGEFGAHVGYQYNKRTDYRYNAPCGGVTWRPVWLVNRWITPEFIFEYDSRTPNIGAVADIWDKRFEAVFELQNFQWISFGIRYKLNLSDPDK